MKAVLLIFFCALTLSAPAQFWKKKKAPVVVEVVHIQLPVAADADTALSLWREPVNPAVTVAAQRLPTKKELDVAENDVMKEAKHHMRYREYGQASYSFTDLAILYLLENRFSEAKWYLLQSNEISREQKDDKHTIANLIMLAQLKAAIGELLLAKADLQEAHDLANAGSLATELATVEKALQTLENSKSLPRAELRYADAVEDKKKTR